MPEQPLDLNAIRDRRDRLTALADQEANGLKGEAYVLAVALAANLSASDVDDLLAEVDRKEALRAELGVEVDRLNEIIANLREQLDRANTARQQLQNDLDCVTTAASLGSSPRAQDDEIDPERMAMLFHNTYERLAPQFGYETREASRKPWAEVPANNRALMIAVCAKLLDWLERGAPGGRPGVSTTGCTPERPVDLHFGIRPAMSAPPAVRHADGTAAQAAAADLASQLRERQEAGDG